MSNGMDGMFTPEGTSAAIAKMKAHIIGTLVEDFRALAIKAVFHPETLTEQESIFHESAMHYDKKRDAPNSPIKCFSEWMEAHQS